MLNDLSTFRRAILSSRMDAEWSYDRKVGRYRNEKGQFLSKKAVGAIVDGRISKLEQQLKSFTDKLINGSITLDQWQGSVREAIGSGTLFAQAHLLLGESFAFLETTLIPNYKGYLLMILPPGGFLVVGFLLAGKRVLDRRLAERTAAINAAPVSA